MVLATAEQLRERICRKSRPKGRQPDDVSLAEVRRLIGPRPLQGHRRDLLIEHLHVLNDACRCLHERHLVALAREMNLAMAAVHEVAMFYHHFEVVKDGEAAPGLTVRVCAGLSCELAAGGGAGPGRARRRARPAGDGGLRPARPGRRRLCGQLPAGAGYGPDAARAPASARADSGAGALPTAGPGPGL